MTKYPLRHSRLGEATPVYEAVILPGLFSFTADPTGYAPWFG